MCSEKQTNNGRWENRLSLSSKWNDHDYTGVGKRGVKELLT